MSIANKFPGFNKKSSMLREADGGSRRSLCMLGKDCEDTMQPGAESRSVSREGKGNKVDSNSSSCTQSLVNKDAFVENTEKNVDADTVSRSSESIENVSGRISNQMIVDTMLNDGQAMMAGLVLESEKINDPKSSSFHIPTVSTALEAKFSNQDHGKFIKKFPDIVSNSKSNVSKLNKLSSPKYDKKLPALPSLKISGNITTMKHSCSPSIHEKVKSVVNFGKTGRFQSMIPSIEAGKQRPSTPSLKRKPSEAVNPEPFKLHLSKRHSPGGNRMAMNLSSREIEDVHIEGSPSEKMRENAAAKNLCPQLSFHQDANMEELGFTIVAENDANIEKAEACAKELEDICSMLKKKHEEAKELLVRSIVNNNNLLMLNHPMYEGKIHAIQKLAARLMSKELNAGM